MLYCVMTIIRGALLHALFFFRTTHVPQRLKDSSQHTGEGTYGNGKMGDGRECYDILRGFGSFSFWIRMLVAT